MIITKAKHSPTLNSGTRYLKLTCYVKFILMCLRLEHRIYTVRQWHTKNTRKAIRTKQTGKILMRIADYKNLNQQIPILNYTRMSIRMSTNRPMSSFSRTYMQIFYKLWLCTLYVVCLTFRHYSWNLIFIITCAFYKTIVN